MRHNLPVKGLIWLLMTVLIAASLAACGSGSSETAQATRQPAPATVPAQEENAGKEAAATATTEAATDDAGAETEENPSADGGELKTFVIDPDQSEARFLINEVLLGSDKTVIGVTSQITGEVGIAPTDPGRTEIGTISIDARDLTTDSSRRNRSIQRFVLRSALDENRYITFEPTAIDGLPSTVGVGEPFDFTVTGDLTVRATTQPVTFDMTVTANSEDEITGLGTATILYADFGISIPSVPAVANVEDEVRLEIEFTAVAD